MVTRDGKQLARESKETCQIAKPEAKHKVSPLRKRMIRDMELAGFTGGTQQTYIGAVVKLQDHYNIRPDRLSEKQVQQYILWLRDEKDVATHRYAAIYVFQICVKATALPERTGLVRITSLNRNTIQNSDADVARKSEDMAAVIKVCRRTAQVLRILNL